MSDPDFRAELQSLYDDVTAKRWDAMAHRAAIKRAQSALAAPVVEERLPELRRTFEQTLNWARCLESRTVGNIELADKLLDAVLAWVQPEPQP